MSWSLLFWVGPAVLLFWAVGAYNRLVRLRAAALQAFAAVEPQLREQAGLAQACLPPSVAAAAADAETDPPAPADDRPGDKASLWSGLRGAAEQFKASLTAARARPLDPDALAGLNAAQGVLFMAWQRLQQDAPHDLAGAALPENLQAQWQQLATQAQLSTAAFNQQIEAYNGAISQFPAVLLAVLFNFRRARGL